MKGKLMKRWLALFCAAACLIVPAPPSAAVVLPGTTVYVARYGPAGDIDTIDSAGAVTTFVTGVPFVAGLDFDSAGNLFATNYSTAFGGGTVQEITPGGTISTFANGLTTPTALTFDRAGNLYVASETQLTITRITPSGVKSVFATVGGEPEGLAFDSAGNLFVSTLSAMVYKVTPGGTVSLFANTHGSFGSGLCIDSTDTLFMANDGPLVDKIGTSGAVSSFAGGGSQMLDLAYDPLGGNIFASDLAAHSVNIVTPAGLLTSFAHIDGPYGIAVATPEPRGAMLIVMTMAARMLRRRRRTGSGAVVR
jgi:hypothetical protein